MSTTWKHGDLRIERWNEDEVTRARIARVGEQWDYLSDEDVASLHRFTGEILGVGVPACPRIDDSPEMVEKVALAMWHEDYPGYPEGPRDISATSYIKMARRALTAIAAMQPAQPKTRAEWEAVVTPELIERAALVLWRDDNPGSDHEPDAMSLKKMGYEDEARLVFEVEHGSCPPEPEPPRKVTVELPVQTAKVYVEGLEHIGRLMTPEEDDLYNAFSTALADRAEDGETL